MLQVSCPWCGVRDEDEFRCGGQSHIQRPGSDCSDAEWADYLFNRDNPKGVSYERWLHTFGCGRWFNVARHAVTHEILAVYRMGEPKPALTPTLSREERGRGGQNDEAQKSALSALAPALSRERGRGGQTI
jgi:heterotetrameric sarcosine oxidase delta subunit